MKPWDHLPNAKLIDRVLTDARSRPEVWVNHRTHGPSAAWSAAWPAAWHATMAAGRENDWDATWGATWAATRGDAWWAACASLVAWDDAAVLLDMPVDAVRLLAASGHHPAVLMLPACIALNGDRDEREATQGR